MNYLSIFLPILVLVLGNCNDDDQIEEVNVIRTPIHGYGPSGGSGNDTITYPHTFRDDVPPPGPRPWVTLDTTDLDACQRVIWERLRQYYPTREMNYWNYRIYAIIDEPTSEDGVFAHREFVRNQKQFWTHRIGKGEDFLADPDLPCARVDTTFFHQALGSPTCRSENAQQIHYYYQFKFNLRCGPCPYIFDAGSEYHLDCGPGQLTYCASLNVHFYKQEEFRLVRSSFWGNRCG